MDPATGQGRRAHDVVLFGASGFVGRLTAAALARVVPGGLRVSLAGRSLERLRQVRADLPRAAADWPLLVADSSDRPSLDELAASTRVLVSTVGPYLRHGLPLVEACAAAGTHYADLTGEVLFVRDTVEHLHEAAVRSGARLVHSCGFDSVPSDLGVLLTADRARREGAGELVEAVTVLVSARGGFSGGTVDSLRTQLDAEAADPARRRVVRDPYALSPAREQEADLGPQPDSFVPRRDALDGGDWTAPFVMAPFNTRIVRRSNALQGWRYGRSLRYREAMGVGRSPAAPVLAGAVTLGVGALAAGLQLRPTRAVLDRVLPRPGTGPSERVRHGGHFHTRTTGLTESGERFRTTVRAQGDPGYEATATMLSCSAVALAVDDLPDAAGVLTPATGIGEALVGRLRDAGFELRAERLR